MRKMKAIRLLPALLLIGGVFSLPGCGVEVACKGGQRELPAQWLEQRFPLIEGGSVCSYEGGKQATIRYKGREFFELHDRYAEKFESDGWKFSLGKQDRSFFAVEKDGASFTMAFSDCHDTYVTCANVSVRRIDRNEPATSSFRK